MIEKPKRQKQLNNQDRQIPTNIQELINRYDLDNTKVYDYLDIMVTEIINLNTNFNDEILNLNNQITELNKQLENVEETQKKNLELNHPIGSLYVTQENINPVEILKFGEWERFNGKLAIGLDENDIDFDTIGKNGGEKTHILTIEEMPIHNHKSVAGGNFVANNGDSGANILTGGDGYALSRETADAGENQAHNNMPPYEIVGYLWIRRR